MKKDVLLEAIVELSELNEKFKNLESKYNRKKQELTDLIFEKSGTVQSIEFDSDTLDSNIHYVATLVNPKKVVFDIEMLEGKLDKELVNEFVDKTYTINDLQGLTLYLKSCGVNPKKFKQFLDVEKKVNNKKLQQLSDLGDISQEDLKGCFKVCETSKYVKISKKEK